MRAVIAGGRCAVGAAGTDLVNSMRVTSRRSMRPARPHRGPRSGPNGASTAASCGTSSLEPRPSITSRTGHRPCNVTSVGPAAKHTSLRGWRSGPVHSLGRRPW